VFSVIFSLRCGSRVSEEVYFMPDARYPYDGLNRKPNHSECVVQWTVESRMRYG